MIRCVSIHRQPFFFLSSFFFFFNFPLELLIFWWKSNVPVEWCDVAVPPYDRLHCWAMSLDHWAAKTCLSSTTLNQLQNELVSLKKIKPTKNSNSGQFAVDTMKLCMCKKREWLFLVILNSNKGQQVNLFVRFQALCFWQLASWVNVTSAE